MKTKEVKIVPLQGDLVSDNLDQLKANFLFLLKTKNLRGLILQMEQVRLIDVAGMSLLVDLSLKLKARGGRLALLKANPQIAHQLLVAELFRFIPLLGDENQARQWMKQ